MKTLLHQTFCTLFIVVCFIDTNAQPTLGFNKILSGLSSPVDIKNAGDGSQRLFIVEQPGKIKIYKNGSVLTKPFLDLTAMVRYRGGEQGLLSVAFHPQYKNNGVFFVYYNNTNGDITLARYLVSKTNPDVADASSGVILFSRPKPGDYSNHNGGTLQFGKDGYLYLSIGDGGGSGDPFRNGQNGQTFYGKMLRLDVNVRNAPYYKIPPDNPFVNDPNVLDEIYYLGLRNPWKWSFDRETREAWIGDVGQDSIEEIDFRKPAGAGANFGWSCYEGTHSFNTNNCKARSNYVFPVFQYHHDQTNGGECVIGGYVYRGTKFTQLNGYYICADYISNNAWKIKPDGAGGWKVFLQKNVPAGIISFGENEVGELFASTSAGDIYHIVVTSNFVKAAPNISPATVTAPTFVYPTLVDNNAITIVLNEAYKLVRIVDINGNEITRKDVSGISGKTFLHFPSLSAGTYIVQLIGNKTREQKIYVTR